MAACDSSLRDVLALLAVVAVTAVWGVTFVQVKDAVALYPLFAFLAVRFAIASGVLALPARRRVWSLDREGVGAGIVLGILLAAAYALQTAGLERTTVSSTGFITGLYVVLTPLLALALFRQRMTALFWVGVVLAVAGLALLSGIAGVGDAATAGGVTVGDPAPVIRREGRSLVALPRRFFGPFRAVRITAFHEGSY